MSELDKKQKAIELFKDPRWAIENFFYVKNKDGNIVPLKLKQHQLDLFNALRFNKRVICLKARQMGFSTAVIAYCLHYALTNPGKTVAFIAYGQDLTTEFLDKVNLFLEMLPEDMRPEVDSNSKYEISFPKLRSKIRAFPSSMKVGRGWTFNLVLCSEVAFWDFAAEKMTSILAAAKKGTVIVESTPSDVGHYFHRLWVGDNEWDKRSYGYWWEYTEEEMEKERRDMNDDLKFDREYNLMFASSGLAVFAKEIIARMRKDILVPGQEVELRNGEKHRVYIDEDGWTIYRPPEPGGLYSMGADSAEGVAGGDDAMACIIDKRTGEEVASFFGKIPPDEFARKLDKKGRQYNNAVAVPEINNTGIATVIAMKDSAYPNMYFRTGRHDVPGLDPVGLLGWRTTTATRPILIQDLVKACKERSVIIHSKKTIDQMEVMVYNENTMRPESQEGFHDDGVFGTGLAVQGFNLIYTGDMSQIDLDEDVGAGMFH